MISQEQYDSLNVGETLAARFKAAGKNMDEFEVTEFEARGKVYFSQWMRSKCLAGWSLKPDSAGVYWTIIERIPVGKDVEL